MGLTTSEGQLTKILVISQHNTLFDQSLLEYSSIVRLWHVLGHSDHIMPDLSQVLHNRRAR